MRWDTIGWFHSGEGSSRREAPEAFHGSTNRPRPALPDRASEAEAEARQRSTAFSQGALRKRV
jgi:hypothetical protein